MIVIDANQAFTISLMKDVHHANVMDPTKSATRLLACVNVLKIQLVGTAYPADVTTIQISASEQESVLNASSTPLASPASTVLEDILEMQLTSGVRHVHVIKLVPWINNATEKPASATVELG